MAESDIGFRSAVHRFSLGLVAHRRVAQQLLRHVDSRLVAAQLLRAAQDTQTGDSGVLAGGGKGMHAVESVQRTFPVAFVIAYLRYAHGCLFLIRVGVHLRQHRILTQRLRRLAQAVIRIRQIIARGSAIASAGAVLRDIVAQTHRRLLVRRLHILHLGGCIQQRILCRGDVHVHLRQVLRVRQIFIYVAALDIQCLKGVQGGVGLFRSRIFLYRLAVGGYGLVVLSQVTEEHGALQRSLPRQRGVGITAQQLLIGDDSAPLVLLLQLGTGDLIHAVVRIVGFGIAFHQVAQHTDLIAVFMLQAEGIAFLEQRIVRSGSLQVRYLRVIRDSLRELAGVEIAVAYAVECVRVGRLGCQCRIDIHGESVLRLVILLLREEGITLQIPRNGVVRRSFGAGTAEEGVEVRFAGGVVAQTVVRLCTHIISLRRVIRTLRVMLDQFRHPVHGLLHLALQEIVGA